MVKKDDILQAALHLIIKNGIPNTPMSAVAETAGAEIKTIYKYYKNKEKLINGLYLKLKEDEALFMLSDYDSHASIKRKFISLWRNIFKYFILHPIEFQFMEQFYYSPLISQESKNQGARFFKELVSIYQSGQEQEIIKTGDVIKQIYFTHGSIASLAKFQILGEIDLNDNEIEQVIYSSWDAVKQ